MTLNEKIAGYPADKQQMFLTIALKLGDEETIKLIDKAEKENKTISIKQTPEGELSDDIEIMVS